MNKYVYTISTVLFFIIAIFTVSLVVNKDEGSTNVAAEPQQTVEVVEETEPEPVVEEQEPEVADETVIEEQTAQEPVEEETVEEVTE